MSVNLIIQSYPIEFEKRVDELLYCLRENLNNPAIASVHNIMEPGVKLPSDITEHPKFVGSVIDTTKTKKTSERIVYQDWWEYPKILDTHPELNDLSKRLTFKYAFDYIRENFKDGEIVAIANDDIKVDYSEEWKNIDANFFRKSRKYRAMSLCRHEGDMQGNIWKEEFNGHSSDLWLFKTPLLNLENVNFCVGSAITCDNAISSRMANAGYQVFNMANTYKIIHVDRIRRERMLATTSLDNIYKDCIIDWSFPALTPDLKLRDPHYWLHICPLFNWEDYLRSSIKFDKLYPIFLNCPFGEHTHK